MREFIYDASPVRVVFGSGTLANLSAEIARLGLGRVLVLSTPGRAVGAQALVERIGTTAAGSFTEATMHTPVAVTERALQVVQDLAIDGLVAVGGGSTTGLAKALALRTDLPQIIVPTTYAGSEMTPILGETRDGLKTTQSDPRIRPEVVIYDVDLTLGLPVDLSGVSGMNAIAHAVEALYARDGNPIIDLFAREGIAALVRALPKIQIAPDDIQARTDALYGAWLCGTCLGAVSMSIHHKLCHVVGGAFDLPHAQTHTIVLPHALAYNAPAVPQALEKLRPILGDNPADALFQLGRKIGAVAGLREIGMPDGRIDEVLDKTFANPYWNPRPLEREAIRALIERAYIGAPPRVHNGMSAPLISRG